MAKTSTGELVFTNPDQLFRVGVPQYGVRYVDDNDVIVYGPDREDREAAEATVRVAAQHDDIVAQVVKVSVQVELA